MSPDEQRVAIANVCGYKNPDTTLPLWVEGGDPFRYIPDYLYDLNAMYEAENVLTYEQLMEYTRQIALVHMQTGNRNDWAFHAFIHIPANERAEAFLKTVGKWEE